MADRIDRVILAVKSYNRDRVITDLRHIADYWVIKEDICNTA